MPRIALNIGLGLAAISVALLRSTRGAHWGPEGAVGGWLLLIPPLFFMGGALVAMVAMGQFDWILGGRVVSFVLLPGFLIGWGAALLFTMDKPQSPWQTFAGVAPWPILAGCLLAVNIDLAVGLFPKMLIAATLGSTALAGWVVACAAVINYLEQQNQVELSKIENENSFEQSQAAEFRALGTDAPLWNYFSYMYMADETLRRECRELIARRPDLNERLAEYLDNPVLASSVINYIGDVSANPAAELAPALARYSDGLLPGYREMLNGQTAISDRAEQDLTRLFAAAARLQKAGGNLKPQVTPWRDFLRGFKNAGELVRQADAILK